MQELSEEQQTQEEPLSLLDSTHGLAEIWELVKNLLWGQVWLGGRTCAPHNTKILHLRKAFAGVSLQGTPTGLAQEGSVRAAVPRRSCNWRTCQHHRSLLSKPFLQVSAKSSSDKGSMSAL